ncbi:hypothetical protein E2C01_044034 [Portunus trituberculatus]|uniref:Uncharacterized protein n=1 Tax=Portunus trituberculatus TaxID=210409 RepID=A0A5B7FS21_PORTR|nr:hypothetical protein [Portunus trituberculatus]
MRYSQAWPHLSFIVDGIPYGIQSYCNVQISTLYLPRFYKSSARLGELFLDSPSPVYCVTNILVS